MLRKIILLSVYFILSSVLIVAQDLEKDREIIKKFRTFSETDSLSDARDIVVSAIENYHNHNIKKQPYYYYNFYQKTFVNVIDRNDTTTLEEPRLTGKKKSIFSHYIIQPFEFILNYARPDDNSKQENITVLLFEDYESVYGDNLNRKKGQTMIASQSNGILQTIGYQNIYSFLGEVFGKTDLYLEDNNIMQLSFKGALNRSNLDTYIYKSLGKAEIKGISCNKIAFSCKNLKENAFAGILYISDDKNPWLVESCFTFNNPESVNYFNDILFVHQYNLKDSTIIATQKKSMVFLGNKAKRPIAATRIDTLFDYSFEKLSRDSKWGEVREKGYFKRDSTYWNKIRPIPLSNAQGQIYNLEAAANQTQKFRRLERTISFIKGNSYSLGGVNGKVELTPLTHFISYNKMEGTRLRVGGNTTTKLSDHIQVGGYLAYGIKDKKFKEQASFAYSLLPKQESLWEYPKKVFTFTYASDLNIPGQDVLTMKRDNFFQSFTHVPNNNMSLQRVGLVTFETENSHNISYNIGTKITYDRPMGVVKYIKSTDDASQSKIVDNITSTDLIASVRFAPGEKSFQVGKNRIAIRRAVIEIDATYRKGIKGLFGANYNYHSANFNIFKRFNLPYNYGNVDTYISGGKTWGSVPFPLLFIPIGNQSYVFSPTAYNNMNFYEFATDRYLSSFINSTFNWSPIRLLDKNDKTKLCLGGKILYGPLSKANDPDYHPELFVFNNGITPLGNKPYGEMSIGLAGIFNILRVDYVRRLTYTGKNSDDEGNKITNGRILISGSISF